MTNDYDLEQYLKEIETEIEKGLLSREEFERIKLELTEQSEPNSELNKNGSKKSLIQFENRTKSEVQIKRLESQFYRTIYGRDLMLDEEDEEFCEQEDDCSALVAKIDGKECGAIWYHLMDENSKDHCLESYAELDHLEEILGSRFLYIEKLFVAKHKRKEGVATSLIHQLMKEYDESTPILVHSWINAKNYYLKQGFIYFKDYVDEQGEQDFIPMLLPMNPESFYSFIENHANRKHLTTCLKYLRQTEKPVPDLNDFNSQCLIPKYCELVTYAKEESYQELDTNPFTILLYKTLGLNHGLIPEQRQVKLF
ncbi:GNAT family N-acetyltransferase [archaeon]|jgi:predicted GNAT family N-acyltransferase|nr:GNAT family N-acetyltransferase [archaeon]MBT3451666.1 GNAT family N-acetyltransferase [archaeon]MBT6869110.1 GNAT family N-acetyltransferase [archaeon]MBT7193353.1 GNAT family N-acetyltransferase [archaeon]MBT7380361.1 GNAT family N-acetyltransferase [archaeon]